MKSAVSARKLDRAREGAFGQPRHRNRDFGCTFRRPVRTGATLARSGGFEPPTLVPRSGDRVSNGIPCAPGRIRTTDFGSAFRRPGLKRNPLRAREDSNHRLWFRVPETGSQHGIPCAPGRIRTTDFRFRRPTLYPTELRAPAAPLITMRGLQRQSFGTTGEIRLAGLCVLSHL
jgi:hypothetical protein